MNFARIDQRPIARWWWTVDRWSLTALGMLVGFGLMLSLAASPSVAGTASLERKNSAIPGSIASEKRRRSAAISDAPSLPSFGGSFVLGHYRNGARV